MAPKINKTPPKANTQKPKAQAPKANTQKPKAQSPKANTQKPKAQTPKPGTKKPATALKPASSADTCGASFNKAWEKNKPPPYAPDKCQGQTMAHKCINYHSEKQANGKWKWVAKGKVAGCGASGSKTTVKPTSTPKTPVVTPKPGGTCGTSFNKEWEKNKPPP